MKRFPSLLRIVGVWIAVAVGSISGPAGAQFNQYTEPGSFEEQREAMDALLERSLKDAKWRLGQVFLQPWIGLRDVSYIDQESDFTATVGAGVRAYLPLKESTFAAYALPEYVWWQDRSEQNRLNGRYGVGYFGNFGRTGIELSLTREDESRFFSRQFEVQVNTREDVANAEIEFDVGRGITLFGGGSVHQFSFFPESDGTLRDDRVAELNRDEQHVRAGLRFHLPRGLKIGLGFETSEVEFTGVANRSHSGTSPILQLDYEAPSVNFTADLAFLDLEPDAGSTFVPYQETAGSAQLSWRSTNRLEVQLFGYRSLVYSNGNQWSYYNDTGLGLALKTSLTSRMSLRVFAEDGRNDYVTIEPAGQVRDDDFEAFGGQFQIRLDRFIWSLRATQTDYDSNLPEFDRSTTVISSGVSLSVGGGSPWG